MKRHRIASWRPVIPVLILAALFSLQSAQAADSSGLKIAIALNTDQAEPRLALGAAVGLTMAVGNSTSWPIYTKLGFSQNEFIKALILTGPAGGKYIYLPADEQIDTMPPAITFGGRQVILTEELPPGVVKKVVVDDLGELFPMLKSTPGWYTIEARQPFIRFAEIIPIKDFGVLGPVDDAENIWRGTVASNKIQFYIYPPSGGQLDVRVVEDTAGQTVPLFQVPVRVFTSADVSAMNSLEEAWSKLKPVLEGTTDSAGRIHWNSEASPCLIGEDYTIVARYSEDYQDNTVAASASGWREGCTGLIEKEIVFIGEVEPPPVEKMITISGSAYYYPEGGRYRASFSMDISKDNGLISGWLKYYYTRTRMSFSSTEISEVAILKDNSVSIRGTGTVNSNNSYTFEAVLVDGSPDSFAISIKDQNDGIYYSATSTNISGGNLQVTIE